jgi:2-polyprenyl-3-methyl-5-hydroxy-6-metoxy-1,4-benzoquinol methylase
LPVETELIACPICETSDQALMFKKDGWNIVRCSSCGLGMVNPRRNRVLEIYESDSYFNDEKYYIDYERNKAAYQKGFRSKLKIICEFAPARGRLLDVGAAYGFFMEEALRFGFEPYGVELAPTAASYAKRYGEIFQKPLSEVEVDKKFSVVAFIDSLEHFENPIAGLEKANGLLEPSGLVAVMVPNIDSTFARLTGSRWHLVLPEEHLFYFTPNSISLAFKKAGFDVAYLGTGGYGRSLAEILRVLTRGQKLRLGLIERLLQKAVLEVNLGDIFVIGRKAG